MSIAQRLVNFSDGLSADGILSAAKGGTGNTTGGGTTSPTISQISYGGDDTATDVAGGGLITLTGTNFASGAKVLINTTPVGVVTVVSSTQITFTAPQLAAGSYILYVVNLDGSTAIAVPGIQYSGVPAWTTAAGSLGTSYETAAISSTLSATSNSAVTYSVLSGTLPSGATLNSNGTISGTSPLVSGSTTYTFTVRATDAELQDTDRQFSLTINPDVVSWSSSNTVTLAQDTASTTTLLATSAAGQTVSYATDTLPTGLTRSGDIVSGTPTVAGTTTTTATATAAVTGKTAQQTITWTVSVAADANWRYTTLLLNSENTTLPFATDASTNNFAVTVVGDTKPSNFNPYTAGYYSNYFDGTGDSLTVTGNGSVVNFGTGDFTIETWAYALFNLTGAFNIIDTCPGGVVSPTNRIIVYIDTDGSVYYKTFQGNVTLIVSAAGAVKAAQWTHVALVKFNNQTKLYVNGTQVGSTYADTLNYPAQTNRPILSANGYDGGSYNSNGYLSNYRIVKGTAVYTTNFTPPTQPLTAIAGTSLLTCQSNRLVDLSTNAYTMTKTGDVAVSSFDPFTPNTSYAAYGSTYFDGTGDYLTVPPSANLAFGTEDFCVEMWYYQLTNTVAGLFSNSAGSGGGDAQFEIQIAASTFYPTVYGWSTAFLTSSVASTASAWNHLVVCRSGTTMSMFLNGNRTATTTTGNNFSSNNIFSIGRQATGSALFTGYISNLRVVKGSSVYTPSATTIAVPTQPLTAVTNTQLLTCQTNQPTSNSQFIDNSTLGGVITRFGNTTQGTFSPYGANWSNYFDGTGDYLSMTEPAATSGPVTIECWIYPVTQVYSGDAFIVGDAGNAAGAWALSFNAENRTIGVWLDSYGNKSFNSNNTINYNAWNHIALVKTGGVIYLYINGTRQTSTYSQAGSFGRGTTINIGRYTGGGQEFTGYISNLRMVYGTAVYTGTSLTIPTQPITAVTGTVLLTCQSGRFTDNGPNAYTITKFGDTSTQKFSPFATVTQTPLTHSVRFDGTGDTLSYTGGTTTTLSGDFTLEAWINLSNLAASQPIMCIGDGFNLGALFFVDSTGKMRLYANNVQIFTGTITVAANTWTHISFVRSASTITGYVNGVAGGTVTNSSQWSGTTTYIGREIYNTGTGVQLSGYISNLRLVKGTVVYTTNFTPSTTPLTAISGTSLLTCQSATLTDNSTNAFALTAAGDTKPRAFNPFGYTTSNSQDYSPQTYGGSMYFDNSGDYLALPTLNTYLIGSGDFTIECWVYKRSTTFDAILSYSSSTGLRIFVNSTGGLELWLGATQQWTFPAVIRNNSWDHVAFVRTGTTLTGYVNGTAVATATVSTNYNAGTLNIGAEAGGSSWGGYISDFRIIRGQALYTANFVPPQTPLTASINTMLLINGDKSAIADKSGKGNLETVGDARISTAVKKYGTASMHFDGSGDYLQIPDSAPIQFGTGDFTIECWFNKTAAGGDGQELFAYFNGASTFGTVLHSNLNSYPNKFTLWIDAYGTGPHITGTTTIALNTWYHLAITRSGGVWKMWLNGTQEGSSYTNAATPDRGYPLRIGGDNYSANRVWSGYIDDFRITKGVARYTANFTPPTSTLLTK